MEEKKRVGISLPVLLLILLFIIGVGLGLIIFRINQINNSENQIVNNTNILNQNRVSVPIGGQTDTIGLSYDIIEKAYAQKNLEITGGFASTYEAILINSEKKEMYVISYSDVWPMHEESGSKDDVEIEIHKLSNKKLNEILTKYKKETLATVKSYLDTNIETNDYDLKLINESIEDIQYNILVSTNTKVVAEANYTEYDYEIVNTTLMKKYNVSLLDYTDLANTKGEDDCLYIEIYEFTEEDLKQYKNNNENKQELLSLSNLIKDHMNEDVYISIREYK